MIGTVAWSTVVAGFRIVNLAMYVSSQDSDTNVTNEAALDHESRSPLSRQIMYFVLF